LNFDPPCREIAEVKLTRHPAIFPAVQRAARSFFGWFGSFRKDASFALVLEPVAVAADIHGRNAKLIFSAELSFDAVSAGLYSRPKRCLRSRRREPIAVKLFSNE
jgi:hypothetical protein